MRLSEAIRLGSMLHPQSFGWLRAYGSDDAIVATCAMGAAEEVGCDTEEYKAGKVACPECPNLAGSLYGVVVHLNDGHRWTREAIADWVATIESAQDHAATEVREAVPC